MSYEWIAVLMFSTMLLMMITGQRVFGAIGFVAVVAALFQYAGFDLYPLIGIVVMLLPSDANYFVARPASPDLGHDLGRLRRQGIKLRDAGSFGLPGCVRLGVLAPAAQDALALAWKEIERTI